MSIQRSISDSNQQSAPGVGVASLIERLEKASGPDRKLDVRILAATQPGAWSAADIEYACSDPERTVRCPAYTSSIDAAMTLVPHGHDISLTQASGPDRTDWYARCKKRTEFGESSPNKSNAATAAIALCIAALKARTLSESSS